MRAMVLEAFGQPLRQMELEKPQPGPGEVLLRVEACGICQTDVKLMSGTHSVCSRMPLPHILGHEVAGTVAALGPGTEPGVALAPPAVADDDRRGQQARTATVADADRPGQQARAANDGGTPSAIAPPPADHTWQVGDRAVVHIYATCGRCRYCRSGRESLCDNLSAWVGFDTRGGMAEYVALPARCLVPLPDGVAFTDAAVAGDALCTAYHAVHARAAVGQGDTLLVVGAGGLGLHAIQIGRALGARVFAADVDRGKFALARDCGAEEAFLSGSGYPERLRARLNRAGVDVVCDFTGHPDALAEGAAALRKGGRLVMVGYRPDAFVSLPTQRTVLDEIAVIGSRYCTRADLAAVLVWLADGRLRAIVGRTFPLEQANEALQLLRGGGVPGRIVLQVAAGVRTGGREIA